jgi:hypothetical protein
LGNLDAICQAAERSMSPTGPTILPERGRLVGKFTAERAIFEGIAERNAHCAIGAYLRNVLIQTLGKITFPIHIGPRKLLGQVVGGNVRVG